MSRVRRHPAPGTSTRPATPKREVETVADLARNVQQREADLALLRALVAHLDEYEPPEDERERQRWAEEEEAFVGMLRRLEEGDQAALRPKQREWALDAAARLDVEWEPPPVTVFVCGGPPPPLRRVEHAKFGKGSVVDESRDPQHKVVVDFDAPEVGRKVLLASYVREVAA